MGKVRVEFHGACVHVRRASPKDQDLPEGIDHRVVIIDGRHGRNENEQTIAPHVPQVHVYDDQPAAQTRPRASLILGGQHLWIAETPRGLPAVQDTERFRCAIPSLREFISTLSVDRRVVVDGMNAAGFFDLSGGTIRAELRHECAGVAIYESQVSDPATLEIRSLNNEGSTSSIALSDEAWIVVSNVGGTLGDGSGRAVDTNTDFLLNYLVSGSIPANAPILHDCRECQPLAPTTTFPFFSIGPGCSNTQYP